MELPVSAIPKFLIDLLVRLAMAVGLPYLMKKFPNWPSELWDIIKAILNYVDEAGDKPAAVKQVREQLKSCDGIGCHLDTVKDR